MEVKKVLIAVDNSLCSEQAAQKGYEIASMFDADVALINIVVPAPAAVSADFPIGPILIENYDQASDNSKFLMEEIANKFARGKETTFLSVIDIASHGITEQAEAWGADLIVIGSHGRGGLFSLLVGSVSESVSRKSTCPVLIIPYKEKS
ncbi:MAG: universal stress protein [Pedobacter sp.]|nr:MAG: universal stress protein [Pedobacter sp.]